MPLGERLLALALILLACWCVLVLWRRRRPGRLDLAVALVLAVGSLWWLFASRVYEGPTVLALTATRGLTAVDLAVVPDLLLATAVLASRVRDRGGQRRSVSAEPQRGRPPAPARPPAPGRSPWRARARRR